MEKSFDSKKETQKHIKRVGKYLKACRVELVKRGMRHDYDKIHNKTEKALFDEYTPKLKWCTYGSDEYKTFLKGLKVGLEKHYANNRHHPEHFANGIKDMNLIDLLEMICDWKAASERHNDGDIYRSLEVNQGRFGYSEELKGILKNTVDFLVGKVK